MSSSPFGGKDNKIDRTDLYWLVYLIFFLIEPVERRSLHYWAETLVILAVFLTLYIVFLRRGTTSIQIALIAGMVALGAATLPINGGAAAFIIYAAALLPFVLTPPIWVISIIVCFAALCGIECLLLHFVPWAAFLNVFFTLVVGSTNLHFAQKHRSDCKLRMQAEEIEALAAVAERERIARDLHDVLGHTLSVIVLKAELANRLIQKELASIPAQNAVARLSQTSATFATDSALPPEPPHLSTLQRAQTEIADVERTARTALGEVREAIGGYRARGLAAEIEAARQILASAGVTLSTEGDLHPSGLSAAEETVLALALREAVTNIVRHAQATSCRLRLLRDHGRYRLSIQDNGQNQTAHEGNGLRGMRERVEALGGHLSLTRDSGTHLQIDLPQRAT